MSNRQYTAKIFQNIGDGSSHGELDLTGKLKNPIGEIEWSVDEDLTVVRPGSTSIEIKDVDNSVWTWIHSNYGSTTVYPYFIVLYADLVPVFVGTASLKDFTKNLKNMTISCDVTDWSSMLSGISLDALERPYPTSITNRPKVENIDGWSIPAWAFMLPDGDKWIKTVIIGGNPGFQVGDYVTCDSTGVTAYQIESIQWFYNQNIFTPSEQIVYPAAIHIQLKGFDWRTFMPNDYLLNYGGFYNYKTVFDRLEIDSTTREYYIVTKQVIYNDEKPTYEIELDTVDNIVPGDTLVIMNSESGSTYTVIDIDGERSTIITAESIEADIAVNDRIYPDEETKKELVYESSRKLIKRVLQDYTVDFSRWTQATLPIPVFNWLPFKVENPEYNEEVIKTPFDMQTSMSAVQIFGLGNKIWEGDPDATFTTYETAVKKVIWTGQLLNHPTSLMEDQTKTISKFSRLRNRTYTDWSLFNHPNQDPLWGAIPGLATDKKPQVLAVHDYSGMIRYTIINNNDITASITTATWNGSVWSSETTRTNPITSNILSAAPLIGTTSTLGTGASLLTLTRDGNLNLIWNSAGIKTISIPEMHRNAILVNTRHGVYLVSKIGYGLVKFDGTTLSCYMAQIGAAVSTFNDSLAFLPNTFAVCESDTVYAMANVSAMNPKDSKKYSEIHLFKLAKDPSTLAANQNIVISEEKISDGVQSLSMAFTHPDGTRIMGLLGGRLFQISNKVPDTIERVNVEGMNALELVAHICQIQNTVAIPSLDKATMNIVSRGLTTPATNISINKTGVTVKACSDQLISAVRVIGAEEDIYADYYATPGTNSLTIDSHPLIWSTSQALAVAMMYADFLGKKRQYKEEKWFWSDPTTIPVWESLQPLQKIHINSSIEAWYVMSLKYEPNGNEANITLLQAVE